ncbi:outer membrane protein [Notoacmeibacter marinus]|uniref:outer membrane protein n=1 Tax=Notoacmeibacter marinus TaxID=1876515 RepID=UPI000DF2A5D2|nr:outer membrane protein [Notoacmeibacter marinus]
MKRSSMAIAGAVLLSSAAYSSTVLAADIYVPEPEVIVEPAPISYAPAPIKHGFGSWYIRGDVSYALKNEVGDIEYITYGPGGGVTAPGTGGFDTKDLDETYDVGVGIGANIGKYFRAELGVDYLFKSEFRGSTSGICGGAVACTSDDKSEVSIITAMANAYVDLGTYHGITPYVGGGIGGAYVKWDKLINDDGTVVVEHEGNSEWRFAWQLMAGASYCLTENLEADIGYRYLDIEGGRMFEYAASGGTGTGPGYDDGFQIHEVKAGLRYNFGGANPRCETAYVPPAPLPPAPPPIYK